MIGTRVASSLILGGYRGYLDVVWLGADLRPMVHAAMEAYHGAGIGRTLVVASGRGTVPACVAMKRRCGEVRVVHSFPLTRWFLSVLVCSLERLRLGGAFKSRLSEDDVKLLVIYT